ncbi:MAG: AsnC family transcriptional regulator [Thaumarchaeota archaeon]|nr:AsnC family transcriptional regulator [Nitrososphaerota archaeon]
MIPERVADTGRAKPPESRHDIVKMVDLITSMGPDIPEIARKIGRHKETVRYWYKEKLIDKGFAVQIAANYEALGLRRIVMVADFADEYKEYAQPILWAMSELCYVNYFNKTLPSATYVIHAAVPEEYVDSFVFFISRLKEKGMFSSVSFSIFNRYRNIPMRAELYDFERGRWDFDWTNLVPEYKEYATPGASEKGKFDDIDLQILKELQLDANTPLAEIATRVKVNYKTLSWHYKKHVLEHGLIKNYRLNWLGTRYDYRLDKAMNRKHYYLMMNVKFRDLTEIERMKISEKVHRLPFVWAEAAGKGCYYVEFAFPTESVPEAFLYLEQLIAPLKGRGESYVMDQTNAITFTISPQLYDQEQRRWKFDERDLLSRFDELILRIKGGAR